MNDKYIVKKQLLISDEMLATIKQEAALHHVSVSSYLRSLITKELKNQSLTSNTKESWIRKTYCLDMDDYKVIKSMNIFLSKFIRSLISRELYGNEK